MTTHIISLGSNCSPAIYLRDHHIREYAHPFDWAVTPFQAVLDHFENDFDSFLKQENLIFLPAVERKLIMPGLDPMYTKIDMVTPVICKKHKTLFPHDFTINGQADLLDVQQKYQKRISRLYEFLNDTSNQFIFISHAPKLVEFQKQQFAFANVEWKNDYDNWKDRLSTVLTNKFPHLKFSCMHLNEFKRQRKNL